MDDVRIPWSTAGTRIAASLAGDGLGLVVSDSDGPGEQTCKLAASALARCGPAPVSPEPRDSLGEWLRSQLQNDAADASAWRVVAADRCSFDVAIADGTGRITCLGPAPGSHASQFRHDARSLLNSIGVNADLVGMLAVEAGTERVEDAAARIRTSSDALDTMISTWTKMLESGDPLPVARVLEDALRRSGIDALELGNEGSPEASSLWCLAAARLFTEWAAWLMGHERTMDAAPPETGRPLRLTCGPGLVSLSRENARLPAGPAFPLLPAEVAAPEVQAAEPTVVLAGLGIGFGAWLSRRGAGVCVGVPGAGPLPTSMLPD